VSSFQFQSNLISLIICLCICRVIKDCYLHPGHERSAIDASISELGDFAVQFNAKPQEPDTPREQREGFKQESAKKIKDQESEIAKLKRRLAEAEAKQGEFVSISIMLISLMLLSRCRKRRNPSP